MTVGQYLAEATKTLQAAGVDSARLDILVLLEDVLQKDRSNLLAHPDQELTNSQTDTLNTFITQRKSHVPVAYIRGKAEFFGRLFKVNKHVLVPRPETESMIELLKTIPFTASPRIADVGTGSGCLGITAALEVPGSHVYLLDTDQQALDTARQNADHWQIDAQHVHSNLLDPWVSDYTVVLANLPYVPDMYPINEAARHEPRLALFSGSDGLDHYRLFWQQIIDHHTKPVHIITESFPTQHHAVALLARHAGYVLHTAKGYAQYFVYMPTA